MVPCDIFIASVSNDGNKQVVRWPIFLLILSNPFDIIATRRITMF